ATAYRNYIKGRVLSRAGVVGPDDFYAGPAPATIYFDKYLNAIPDKVNIPGNEYDERANTLVLEAGSGAWTLSAEEYSAFVSSLWNGKIVSAASVADM